MAASPRMGSRSGAPRTAPDSAPAPRANRAVKVIYVMGAGHSGSTILGVALGNCEGSFYAGEVDEWLITSGEPGVGGIERKEFWGEVAERMRETEAAQLFGGEVNRLIERSSALLRPSRWGARRALRRRYRAVAGEL